MSFVFQDVVLFNDTVYNNIKIGNLNATEEQVMAVAKAAYCDEFIEKLPDGYHTVLGENGSTLSGGERQRVALIRNILFLPKVLLLDEVTAGLDENNKQIVHAWLRQLNEQDHVTTIMITHDATEIAAADQLAKVIAGRLEVHA